MPAAREGSGRAPGWILLLAFAALAVLAAGCTSQPAVRLRLAGDPTTQVGSANHSVPYGQPLSKGSIMLCLTEAGTAILSDVTLSDRKGDLSIDAFAARPRTAEDQTPLLGDAFSPLDTIPGFVPSASQEITAVCDDPSSSAAAADPVAFELGLELSWTRGEVAGGAALELTYLIDGQTVHSTIPWEIWVCREQCPDDVFVH
jgi:hypothetical protein